LRHALKIHRRCQPRSKKEDKEFSAEILGLLTRTFPQFSDWKELVKDREHDDVEKVGLFLIPGYPRIQGQV
jgi:Ca2+-transporting ATPase